MKLYFFEENIDKMGGVERIISLLANNLSEYYETKVISLKKTKKEEFFSYYDRVERIYIDEHNYLSSWHNNKNIIKKKIYSLYYRFNNMLLLHKKKKLFRNIKEDDVLIFGRIQVALKWLPYLKPKNKIIIRDANHYYCNNEKDKSKINNLLSNYTNLLIVSSEESKKVYKKVLDKCPTVKKIYNPLGILPENLYNYDSKKIVAVGRYDTQKAFDVLLKAFSLVYEKNSDWSLEIVGPKYAELEDLILELNIKDSVKVTPALKDVKLALKDSSLCVMTSRYEGYANSLVEALVCAIPSISFNFLLGVEEIIKDGENGEVVKLKDRFKYFDGKNDDEDIANLANTISKLIENRKLMDKYSKNAIKMRDSRNKENIIECWKEEIEILEND